MPPHPLCVLRLVQEEEGVFYSKHKNSKEKKNHFKIFREIKAKEESQTESFSPKNSESRQFFKTKLEAIKRETPPVGVLGPRGGNQRSVNDLVLCDTCLNAGLSSSK